VGSEFRGTPENGAVPSGVMFVLFLCKYFFFVEYLLLQDINTGRSLGGEEKEVLPDGFKMLTRWNFFLKQ
jgi:hypothetical protein